MIHIFKRNSKFSGRCSVQLEDRRGPYKIKPENLEEAAASAGASGGDAEAKKHKKKGKKKGNRRNG